MLQASASSTAHMLTPRSVTRAARSLTCVNAAVESVRAAISSKISGRSTRGSRSATAARSATSDAGSSILSRLLKISSSLPSMRSKRTAGLLGSRAATAR